MFMRDDDCRKAMGLIDRMMDVTQRIVAASSEPGEDMLNLVLDLRQSMSALQVILADPAGSGFSGDPRALHSSMMSVLVEGMKNLALTMDKGMVILRRQKMRIEREMASTRQSQKALQAYGVRITSLPRNRSYSLS